MEEVFQRSPLTTFTQDQQARRRSECVTEQINAILADPVKYPVFTGYYRRRDLPLSRHLPPLLQSILQRAYARLA